MHVKKIIIIASCVLLLCVGIVGVVFFSQGKEETIQKGNVYQTSSYITEEMKAKVQKCDVNLCLSEEYTPEKLLKDADEIVIASVISIDSATAKEGLFGITRGKIVINNSLKGNFKTGDIVQYAKNGGIFTMAEWESTQPEAANAKRAYLRQKEGLDLEHTLFEEIIEYIDVNRALFFNITSKNNSLELYEKSIRFGAENSTQISARESRLVIARQRRDVSHDRYRAETRCFAVHINGRT